MATITGTALDDSLVGVAGQVDTLYGLAGNDTLTGGGELVAPIVRVTGNGGVRDGASLSADGRYVLFKSGLELLPGETNPRGGLFLKDMATGSTIRVGTTAAGVQPSPGSGFLDSTLNGDGRYAVFTYGRADLVPGDTNKAYDIFLKDTLTGAISRVNTSAAGVQATDYRQSANPAVSADGRFVAFESNAINLVLHDTNGAIDIFLKDTLTGAITRVNTDVGGAQATGGASTGAAVSADGRYVVFGSDASNLVADDTNGTHDVFLKDTQTGAISRVSTTAAGAQANGYSADAAISPDGRYVAFASGATNLMGGDAPVSGLFLKDMLTGAITHVAQNAGHAAFSADARYVVFESYDNNLVPGDTNGAGDVFVKDMQTGAIARVSVAPDGSQLTGVSYWTFAPTISADGRYIAFTSDATNLVEGDTNGSTDVFRVLNPLLDGDVLRGGLGDDTYLVALPKDQVIEAANEGVDTVRTRISYTLSANVENLVLEGDAAVRGTGNALANSLTGNNANNFLNGGAGADTMAGGGGNDTYVVDNRQDIVTELPGAGTDTILSSVSLWLPRNVENLRLMGATGSEALNGTGNGLGNLITGNAGNNVLNGRDGVDTVSYANATAGVAVNLGLTAAQNTVGAGTDTLSSFENLTGSAHDDSLNGNAGDNVIEGGAGNDVLDGGAGSDTASYAAASAAVTVNLGVATPQNTGGGGTDTLTNFENLFGSRFSDTLTGDAGDNALRGGPGNDTLTGGGGRDTFVFNTKMTFYWGDTIMDFLTGTDKIAVSQVGLRVGDGDTLVENAVVAGPGGFAPNAELVIFNRSFSGPISEGSLAGTSANAAYAAGATAFFALSNGTDTGFFSFTSSGADAVVSSTELTLLGTARGTITGVELADFVFVP